MNSGIIPNDSKSSGSTLSHRFPRQRRLYLQRGLPNPITLLADRALNDFVETDKRATADEENFFGIDLDIFLMRMLAPSLRRNIAGAAFQDLQQRLLDTFAGDVAGDAETLSVLRPILSISSM